MEGNILANKSDKDRPETDFYPTPKEVTVALLRYLNLPIETGIWEPACGKGHMVEVMRDMGYGVVATDLNDFGYGAVGIDYIDYPLLDCDWIITNPPFSRSVEFIKQSIKHRKPFALLLKSQYWHSKNRMALFNEFRPKAVLPLTWRPNFLFDRPLKPGEKKKDKPTMEVYWTAWESKPATVTEYALLDKPKCI